ncbi:MAG TPA: hypothetical protein VFT08_02955 [Pyrinomonadaceae bacterium]|nr:hypothetical protein [Pyrinomonadaceae bacterium]
MSRPFAVKLPLEQAYTRRSTFAIELLDAVTLARVSQGVTVTAKGLQGKPIINAGGLFVWLLEDLAPLQNVSIDPGTLPYEPIELAPGDLTLPPDPRPLTTVELPPRVDYVFPAGVTGLRGTLIESRIGSTAPVQNAEVRLNWLDEDDVTRHDAPTLTHTNSTGDFVSILRFAPAEKPNLDNGSVTVRLNVRRDGLTERSSADFKLLQGRVTDPSTLDPLTFAWDELQP